MMEMTQILEFINKIYKESQDLSIKLLHAQYELAKKSSNQSESIDLLATALAKTQAEMPVAKKDSENPFFKSNYADLEQIVSTSRPYLAKNGLSVTQKVITDANGSMMLHTILMHSSGQWTESTMRVLPPKNDIQTISSYITYLKRINYSSIIGVVAADEDDDGEKAVQTQRESFTKATALNHKYNPREESADIITKEQFDELDYELQEYPDIGEEIKEKLRLSSLTDLPKSKYRAVMTKVREIKLTRNGK